MRVAALISLLMLSSPAMAEPPGLPQLTSEQLVERAKLRLNAVSASKPCGRRQLLDEIIVCGVGNDALRLKPIKPVDNQQIKALNLHAPGPHGGVGVGVTVGGLCLLQKCPPPPILYIDVKSLPEAPSGSDADKVARGEMPDH